MMFGSPYEDDTAYLAPTQVIVNNIVSMKIDLSQKYRSHHITYIFLEPPENVTFGLDGQWRCMVYRSYLSSLADRP